jgi:CubicO group peptidase (beta-lactamase class C family)
MADLEHDVPNTPDTIFEAGSVSKQFTAAAVLLLARDGKLSLDDPCGSTSPNCPTTARHHDRHMLNHTSGLRDWGSVAAIGGWPRTTRAYTHAHVLDIVSRQRALNFTPGAQYSYSNSGYNLPAIIVSRVSGMSFAEFSQQRIFEPLGMSARPGATTTRASSRTASSRRRGPRIRPRGRHLRDADAVRERARQRRPADDGRRSAQVERELSCHRARRVTGARVRPALREGAARNETVAAGVFAALRG